VEGLRRTRRKTIAGLLKQVCHKDRCGFYNGLTSMSTSVPADSAVNNPSILYNELNPPELARASEIIRNRVAILGIIEASEDESPTHRDSV